MIVEVCDKKEMSNHIYLPETENLGDAEIDICHSVYKSCFDRHFLTIRKIMEIIGVSFLTILSLFWVISLLFRSPTRQQKKYTLTK